MNNVDTMQQSETIDATAARGLTRSTMNSRSSREEGMSGESFENRSRVRIYRLEEAVKKIMQLLGQQATKYRTEDDIMDITAEQITSWIERLLDEVLRTQGRSRATTNESTTQTEMTEEKNRCERRK